MENLELVISLASACLGLVVAVAAVIAKYASSAKARKAAEQTMDICNALLPYIEQAESFVNYSGEEKKEYVMTKANRYAIEHGMKFNESAVSDKVEEYIALSKEVNAKDTAKTERISEASAESAGQKSIKISLRK